MAESIHTELRSDTWLSERLGKPAYDASAVVAKLTSGTLPEGPAFVGAKVPVSDIASLLHLQNLGFRVIDTNVQLHRDAGSLLSPTIGARIANPEDEAGARAIASQAFIHDRFHRDPSIDAKIASRIKADWVGNFFTGGRGEWMVVAGEPSKPEGFLQLLRGADDTIVIDLIATADSARGKGMARTMIAFAAETCLGKMAKMSVGTQIANIPSLRLYTKMGFRIASASYVLHLHCQGQLS